MHLVNDTMLLPIAVTDSPPIQQLANEMRSRDEMRRTEGGANPATTHSRFHFMLFRMMDPDERSG
jgi:hypothetical protein